MRLKRKNPSIFIRHAWIGGPTAERHIREPAPLISVQAGRDCCKG
jgi:hypothetical protein